MGLTSCSCFRLQKYCGSLKWHFTHSIFPFCYFLLFYAIFMNGYNCVANNLTIAALVFLGAKVGNIVK